MDTHNKLVECPICKNIDLSYLNGYQKLYLLKCSQCNFTFDQRVPTTNELSDHYNAYKYSHLRPITKETVISFNKLLDYFEQYRELGNMLDLSCGQGDFLAEAKKRNWNVYGSEYSEAATHLCRERGIKMHQGDLSTNIFNNIKFDVITSFEVIEHVNNPHTLMSLTNNKLRQKGIAYCTTPNFNSLLRYFEKDKFMMINFPEHLSYYTKASIRYLGRENNFKALTVKTTGIDIGRLIIKPQSTLRDENQTLSKDKETASYRKRYESVSENARKMVGSNLAGSLMKVVINYFLNIFGLGDTLKVFWIKSK